MANIITDREKIEEVLTRGIENVYPSKEEAMKKLQEGKELKIYLGIDPTGPNIHLGHTIPLLFLKRLQSLGHKPVLLIGDFTARIGDPTDKNTARKKLSEEDVKENMKTYLDQIHKILPEGSFELKYNSEWLKNMTFEDVIHLASKVTVQQMLARDMFKKRIKEDKPISVQEFLYPIMQGYDSVAMDIDGEVGGNDQTFNMLVGRDFMKSELNKNKLVFTIKLLVDADSGKKMSKSEGGLISINDEPNNMFGKVMATIPDEMIKTVFELATEVDMDRISELEKKKPKEFKEELAFELVKMYHGEENAKKAKEEFANVFSKGGLPEEMEEISVGENNIVDILVDNKIVDSKSEAKRIVEQGGVKINDELVKNWEDEVNIDNGAILKVGPRKFYKLKK